MGERLDDIECKRCKCRRLGVIQSLLTRCVGFRLERRVLTDLMNGLNEWLFRPPAGGR